MTTNTRGTIAEDCQVSLRYGSGPNRSCIHVISDGAADCYPMTCLVRLMQGGDILVLDDDHVRVGSYASGTWTIDVKQSGTVRRNDADAVT